MALIKQSPLGVISGKIPGGEIALTRSGPVLKSPKRQHNNNTPRFNRMQLAWNHRKDLWHQLPADEVKEWEAYAAANPTTNRLGTQVYLTAFQAFMMNLLDTAYTTPYPDLTEPPQTVTEPTYNFTATLTAGGPYTITAPSAYANKTWLTLNLRVARWMPYQQDSKPRTWINVGTYQHTGDASTWYERFQARGIDLVQGERVALRMRKHYIFSWPSRPVILYTTVL